jgi:chemotaxis protein histidine kinase CheA
MDVEILQDYLVESKELLQKAQEDTLRLEADPGNHEVLASIFRAFHTIKGGAGFLEAGNLVDWAHDLEDLLDKLRNHTLPITSARIDAILKTFAHEARTAGIPMREKVAMVLTDLEMPEMDGFTLTRQMKEDDVLRTVPVVIHSSLSGSANESHANRVGADGYVAKFVPDELAREVVKILAIPAH